MKKRLILLGGAALALTLRIPWARAEDLGTDIREDRAKIHSEESDIRRDRHELREDIEHGDAGAAAAERRDIQRDERQLHRDRADIHDDVRRAHKHNRHHHRHHREDEEHEHHG